jgi:hypothetical protein
MRNVKSIFFVLLGLFLVMLAISSLLPGTVMNSRWVKVGVPREQVSATVRNLETWPEWNLLLADAADVRSTSTSLQWKDPRGTLHQCNIIADNDSGLVTTLTMGSGRPMESGFAIQQNGADSVQIVWYVIEDLRWYPWEKFYGIMAGDMKGPLLQGSLDRLRDQLHEEALLPKSEQNPSLESLKEP